MKSKQQIQDKLIAKRKEHKEYMEEYKSSLWMEDVKSDLNSLENEVELLEWVLDLDNAN